MNQLINDFYVQFQLGRYDHPYDLAKKLEELANHAWDEVDAMYPHSMLP